MPTEEKNGPGIQGETYIKDKKGSLFYGKGINCANSSCLEINTYICINATSDLDGIVNMKMALCSYILS